MSPRLVGIVRRWDGSGAFGFIRARRAGQLVSFFTHRSLVETGAPLARGHLVEFTPQESARGPRATHVRRPPPLCPKCSGDLRSFECPACGFEVGS